MQIIKKIITIELRKIGDKMFNNIIDSIKEKYNNIKRENDILNSLTNTTTTFQNLLPIPELTNQSSEFRISYITNNCPDINEEKAKLISKLIPINETFLSIFYSKEILTNQEYYLIFTNKYLWIMNKEKYGTFYYNNLICSIIKNNIMSKILLLNNTLIEINGNENKINEFIQLINNPNIREQIIREKESYLCGITPITQIINSVGSGISYDINKTIIFHTKEKNYKYQIQEIENYEILLDNQVYSSKKTALSKTIGSFQNDCYQISIRITTFNKEIIILPILLPNTFGTKYNSHDNILQKNLEFANNILNELNSLNNQNY